MLRSHYESMSTVATKGGITGPHYIRRMPDMAPELVAHAEAARGFMPPDEGLALHDAAVAVEVDGPFLEIGSYCGKSGVYLGAAAAARGTVLFAVDHHRGSAENQPGWEFHEPDLVDPDVGRIDTLPRFRRTIADAGLEPHVVPVAGESATFEAGRASGRARVCPYV